MDLETYIRQLEDSKERGNKVASIDNVLSFLRSIRHQNVEDSLIIDFPLRNEHLQVGTHWKPYTGL